MNSRLQKFALVLGIVSITLLLAGPASAQWISGSKLTVDNVDTNTLQVDLTGSIFYQTAVTFSTAFLGVQSNYGTPAPAISFGDGSTLAPYWPGGSGIPFDQVSTPTGAPGPVRAYRMAFSHTYGADGDYTVTINSHFTGGISPALVFTGNTATVPTPSYATYGGVRTFVQNTATVSFGPGLGGNPFDPNIPTTSEIGLLALALLLGTAGVFFLRR